MCRHYDFALTYCFCPRVYDRYLNIRHNIKPKFLSYGPTARIKGDVFSSFILSLSEYSVSVFPLPTLILTVIYCHCFKCHCGWCMLSVFLLPAFTRLGHECQDLLSLCDGMHVCTTVYTLIRKSFGGMESEPMLSPTEKSTLPEDFSSEEDGTRDAASSRTASPTHYQWAIPAPKLPLISVPLYVFLFCNILSLFSVPLYYVFTMISCQGFQHLS